MIRIEVTRRSIPTVLLAALFAVLAAAASAQTYGRFTVEFEPALQSRPYTGRVYLLIGPPNPPEPRRTLSDWFLPPAVYAFDVVDHDPSVPIVFDAPAVQYPQPFEKLPAKQYMVQAVAPRNPDSCKPGEGEGDLFSEAVKCTVDPARTDRLTLRLSKSCEEPKFQQIGRFRYFEMESKLLSDFHKRPVKMRASVLLPTDWKSQPNATWPTVYTVTGFGGTIDDLRMFAGTMMTTPEAQRTLNVLPDATCHYGHSVFADSETNGPWGRALVEEFIPAVEAEFRGAGMAERRFVWGVSSGGWASLWLGVTYPEHFAAIYAHAPDPVDFRSFQNINLYDETDSFYVQKDGSRRPIARFGGRPSLWYDDFVKREEAVGDGGQIRSFEAVFSPRGPDGRPLPVFDRATGRIDPAVVKAWERYDINKVLERNWDMLGPRVRGKLNVIVGADDNFYLEGAVVLLRETMKKLGSDGHVVVVPGMGHTADVTAVRSMYRKAAATGAVGALPAKPGS